MMPSKFCLSQEYLDEDFEVAVFEEQLHFAEVESEVFLELVEEETQVVEQSGLGELSGVGAQGLVFDGVEGVVYSELFALQACDCER